jgi:tRNA-dihydrouridine synthase B
LPEQMEIILGHLDAMLSHYGTEPGVRIARKHMGWYSKGLPGSAEFRAEINRTNDPAVMRQVIADFYAPLLEKAAA